MFLNSLQFTAKAVTVAIREMNCYSCYTKNEWIASQLTQQQLAPTAHIRGTCKVVVARLGGSDTIFD